MKVLMLIFSFFIVSNSPAWLTNFDEARRIALQKNEKILLNFSGSDWCGSCIRLHEEIFESAAFKKYAEQNLVLLNADFPRNKKNSLAKEQLKHNEALAEKYNPKGKFPYTLLLNRDGNILKEWDGFPAITTTEFVNQVTAVTHDNN